MTQMTTEEAFVKVLQMHGIECAFGIIGSAFTVVVSGGGSVSGVSSIVVARRRSLSMIASIIIIMSVGSV